MSQRKTLQSSTGPTLISSAMLIGTTWANVGPRTNNNIEGFHNKLKNRIQNVHHNRFEFVQE